MEIVRYCYKLVHKYTYVKQFQKFHIGHPHEIHQAQLLKHVINKTQVETQSRLRWV